MLPLLVKATNLLNSLGLWAAGAPGDPGSPTEGPGGQELQNPAPRAPDGLAELANDWIAYFKWAGMVAGALGLMACGIMMAIGRRNRSHLAGEGASGILWVLAGLSTVTLAVTVVNQMM